MKIYDSLVFFDLDKKQPHTGFIKENAERENHVVKDEIGQSVI